VLVPFSDGSNAKLGILLKCPMIFSPSLSFRINDTPCPQIYGIDSRCKFKDTVRIGDILVAVDGKDIHRLVNVPEIIKSKLKKGPLKLTFIRKISNV